MKLTLISHFFSEALLLPSWIKHHAEVFDEAILIDHHSTDNSVEIAKSLIPSNWKIITTRLSDFNAQANDHEIEDIEASVSGWKMTLNTTEFLFCPNFKEFLAEKERQHPDMLAFGTRAVSLVDKEELPIENPIWVNRTNGILNFEPGKPTIRPWRFIHKAPRANYVTGRHGVHVPNMCLPEFLHLHFVYSPWPQCIPRKMQIQTRIPESDKAARLGFQHNVNEVELNYHYNETLMASYDLMSEPVFKQCYDELLKGNF
jgi:hypothetical protein